MNHEEFVLYACLAGGLWFFGTLVAYLGKSQAWRKVSYFLVLSGIAVLVSYIVQLWYFLERPPLRTLGETRLWYGVLLPVVGVLVRYRWNTLWLQTYSLVMAILFVSLNIANPDVFDRTLMPALQSPWFVPHVVVYLEAYALLAASSLIALRGLYLHYRGSSEKGLLELADNIVYFGYAFLTFGLLFGALWAKTAWGHYWTWDPKETWALLTWLCYLIYIHLRKYHPNQGLKALWLLSVGFVVLLLCWFGINYLPAASLSVHTYSG